MRSSSKANRMKDRKREGRNLGSAGRRQGTTRNGAPTVTAGNQRRGQARRGRRSDRARTRTNQRIREGDEPTWERRTTVTGDTDAASVAVTESDSAEDCKMPNGTKRKRERKSIRGNVKQRIGGQPGGGAHHLQQERGEAPKASEAEEDRECRGHRGLVPVRWRGTVVLAQRGQEVRRSKPGNERNR